MENLELYNKVRVVPDEAQKTIGAGRLKGMTDINPMWRIQELTAHFGIAGIGWYYDILKRWTEDGADGEKCAFCEIALYIKHNEEWSKPIIGTGGSRFISNERNGRYTSDEAYKMALTDAISVSCKALGFGADVYWKDGRTKYLAATPSGNDKIREKALNNPSPITDAQVANLEGIFGLQPDGGKVLRTLLLGDRDIKSLTNVEYAEVLHKMNAKKQENIKAVKNYIKAYANVKNIKPSEAKDEIEQALNITINDSSIGWDCSELCAKIQELAER